MSNEFKLSPVNATLKYIRYANIFRNIDLKYKEAQSRNERIYISEYTSGGKLRLSYGIFQLAEILGKKVQTGIMTVGKGKVVIREFKHKQLTFYQTYEYVEFSKERVKEIGKYKLPNTVLHFIRYYHRRTLLHDVIFHDNEVWVRCTGFHNAGNHSIRWEVPFELVGMKFKREELKETFRLPRGFFDKASMEELELL